MCVLLPKGVVEAYKGTSSVVPIIDLVKEALDPIDLEEHQVLGQIQSKMPDELKEFDVYTW